MPNFVGGHLGYLGAVGNVRIDLTLRIFEGCTARVGLIDSSPCIAVIRASVLIGGLLVGYLIDVGPARTACCDLSVVEGGVKRNICSVTIIRDAGRIGGVPVIEGTLYARLKICRKIRNV